MYLRRLSLEKLFGELKSLSVKDRILKMGLKPDRAEVIVPGLEIYLACMKWGKINQIYIPKVGLSDGLVYHLYKKYTDQR